MQTMRNVCSLTSFGNPSLSIFPFFYYFSLLLLFFVTNLMIFASKLKRFFIDPARGWFRVRLGVSFNVFLLCQLELVNRNPFNRTRTDCGLANRIESVSALGLVFWVNVALSLNLWPLSANSHAD